MKPVCEVMVQHVFPALRASIAKELITEYELNQSEVASMLGVSQPAISQYLRQLRGENKKFMENKIIENEIKNISSKIYAKRPNPVELMNDFCGLCKIITSKKIVCDLHNTVYKLENCSNCCNENSCIKE
jgi:predicted transcriptional regulator